MNPVWKIIVSACYLSLVSSVGCGSGGGSLGNGQSLDDAGTSEVDTQSDSVQLTDSAGGADVITGDTSTVDMGGTLDVIAHLDSTTSDVQITDTASSTPNPLVTIVTSMGEFTIELKLTDAPITTANFLMYIEEGFYDGDDGLGATTFHRIIQGFMIQGGGVRADMSYKDVHPAIVNESTNGLKNVRGSVAMARKNDPDTATSQFFVNHVDNDFLDYTDAENPGYAVFGQVVSGMDVVDAIADVPTNPADMPFEPIEILNVVQ